MQHGATPLTEERTIAGGIGAVGEDLKDALTGRSFRQKARLLSPSRMRSSESS